MEPRWPALLRVVLAAALLGALVALVASGSESPLWLIVLLLALLAGIALWPLLVSHRPAAGRVTDGRQAQAKAKGQASARASRMSEAGRPSQKPASPRPAANPPQRRPSLEQVVVDEPSKGRARPVGAAVGHREWERLGIVCAAVAPTTVRWLRSQDFDSPWLDERVRPVIDIAPEVAELAGRPFPNAVSEALLLLAVALEQFTMPYERYTSPDPFVPYEEWRFYGWGGNPDGVSDAELLTAPTQLAELSTRVADTFDTLVLATADYQPIPRSGTA